MGPNLQEWFTACGVWVLRAAERVKKKERIPGEWKVVASLKRADLQLVL